MKKIYVILMHTNTIPSKFVKYMTHYKYSHVGISLKKNCNTIYSFGRKKLNSILNGGFTIQNKNGEFFKKFDKTICKIYEISITNEQYKEVSRIIKNMKLNSDNYKYDFLGAVLRYLKMPIKFKNKYVCSYFVASILEEASIYNFNKRIQFVKPKDFENIEIFNEIYNGSYLLYK